MAKYNELLEKYQADIARLRKYKAWASEALAACEEHDAKEVDWSDELAVADHHLAGSELAEKWQDASQNFQIEAEKLTQDIDAEYQDVPFSAPRNQGIEKFWELAGL